MPALPTLPTLPTLRLLCAGERGATPEALRVYEAVRQPQVGCCIPRAAVLALPAHGMGWRVHYCTAGCVAGLFLDSGLLVSTHSALQRKFTTAECLPSFAAFPAAMAGAVPVPTVPLQLQPRSGPAACAGRARAPPLG